MDIWDESVKTVLGEFLSSTAHYFYATELVAKTQLTEPTILKTLKMLRAAGYVVSYVERAPALDSLKRAPRIYYCLTVEGVNRLRLKPPQTVAGGMVVG